MKITKRKDDNRQLATTTNYTPVRSIFDDFFRMPTLMDEMFGRSTMPNYSSLSADVWEEGDNFFVKMALPGIDKKDVDIEIDADVVRIKGGSKEKEEQNSGKKFYLRTLDSQFEQSFNLPTVVDADKAEATFKDGVLELKLPKAEQYKPKKVSIG